MGKKTKRRKRKKEREKAEETALVVVEKKEEPKWNVMTSEKMQVVIPDRILLHLESWVASAQGREVSGVGIMDTDEEEGTFTLTKVWLLAAGTSAYTEIPGATMAKLVSEGITPDQIKVWWHRHPVGNGIPGAHNWSSTDDHTAMREPFGISPDLVGWLVSIVRTPLGWVARYDNHNRMYTVHMPVKTSINGNNHKSVYTLIKQHDKANEKARMQRAAQVTNGKGWRPAYPRTYKTWDDETLDQWIHEKEEDLKADHEERLKATGWDREMFFAIREQLQYDQPEFVAFDNGVLPKELIAAGLIAKDKYMEMLRRIQHGIDGEDFAYIILAEEWQVEDF
jgi:hypothetical protein